MRMSLVTWMSLKDGNHTNTKCKVVQFDLRGMHVANLLEIPLCLFRTCRIHMCFSVIWYIILCIYDSICTYICTIYICMVIYNTRIVTWEPHLTQPACDHWAFLQAARRSSRHYLCHNYLYLYTYMHNYDIYIYIYNFIILYIYI